MSTAPAATTPATSVADRMDALTAKLEALLGDDASRKGFPPAARTGEDPLTSRGFQFSRVAAVMAGKLDPSQATVEISLSQRIQKEYVERGLFSKEAANSIVVPLSSELIGEAGPDMQKFAGEVGEIVKAGMAGYDPEEAVALRRKHYAPVRKTLNWLDTSAMGALVPPPEFAEPIELLRNKEVFLAAGARVIPFPPSGRVVWPRFTGATTAYWLGTGANDRSITASEPTTGDMVLTVKKLGVLTTFPNELLRFPTVAVEAILRADMALSASLKMDKAFLEGTGSAYEPKGVTNYANILTYTAGNVGANGDSLAPEDILQIIAQMEEKNIDFTTWVGRPKLYAGLGNKRSDAVTAGDAKGPWMFNILRDGKSNTTDPTNNSVGMLEGYPFHKSNQVSNARSKGSATNLTYLAGLNMNHVVVALSGVMEIALATQGDTIFPQDQTTLRTITWTDMALRHEEAVILVDTLVQTG
jgi:HK97 family phage major capsid protein